MMTLCKTGFFYFYFLDVLQHSADRLSQASEASAGVLFRHVGHPGWINQDHSIQKPPC